MLRWPTRSASHLPLHLALLESLHSGLHPATLLLVDGGRVQRCDTLSMRMGECLLFTLPTTPLLIFHRHGSSPRNLRSSRLQTNGTASSMEDEPPTVSLREHTEAMDQPLTMTNSNGAAAYTLPTPSSLIPSADTHSLLVFGPPANRLSDLRGWLEDCGPIVSYRPGPEGTNWWIVEYATPTAASWALRRHGEVIASRWIVGFKVVTAAEAASIPRSSGGPIPIVNVDVLKPKPAAVKNTDSYPWEEADKANTFGDRVAEWLVSLSFSLKGCSADSSLGRDCDAYAV